MGQHLIELLDTAGKVVQRDHNYCLSSGYLSSDSILSGSALAVSLRSFVICPIFRQRDGNCMDAELSGAVTQSMCRLLRTIVQVYEGYSNSIASPQSEVILQDLASVTPLHGTCSLDSDKSRIVDMELDVNEDSRDGDVLNVGGATTSGVSSPQNWKLGMISLFSSFFSALHSFTWEVLFEIMKKEVDSKV